jgi:hypothetical protein
MLSGMANAVVKWKLKKAGSRLRALRAELIVIDEQRPYLSEEADDLELRAIVDESSHTRLAAREAGGHAGAMARARTLVVAEIARLETKQDQLLDRLSGR